MNFFKQRESIYKQKYEKRKLFDIYYQLLLLYLYYIKYYDVIMLKEIFFSGNKQTISNKYKNKHNIILFFK